ncbi:MAG: TOBE domain-containing protein, partial [Pseudomonadota bacterium]
AGSASGATRAHVSLRPERLSLAADGGPACTVERLIFLGTDTQHIVRLADGTPVTVRTQNAADAALPFGPGDSAALIIEPGAARILAD